MDFTYHGDYWGVIGVGDGETNGHRYIGEASPNSASYFGNTGIGLQTERMAENEEIEWPVIGIDLGTTNSCVAVWHEGRVEIIPNELGNRTTPSVVSFTDYGRLVGEAATNQASKNLVNTIYDAKRLIGRPFSDDIVQQDIELWPFKVIRVDRNDSNKSDLPMIVVKYMGKETRFTPEEITAMTLAKMKGVAEAFLDKTVKNAVITVPAHFNSSQRQATIDAGAIAGFNKIYLLNEPSAAAIAYSLDAEINNKGDTKKNVFVFHLGGGTFDVSLVEINKGEIRVKSTCGDSHLGGTDFDNRMVCDFREEFKNKHKKDISKNPRALARLRVESEKAKRLLFSHPQAEVDIDCLFEGIDFRSTITCARFETLNTDLFQKCEDAIDQCLKSAHIYKGDVDDVVLVGGSSRVLKVRKMLNDCFYWIKFCKSIHPDEAVASGAAIHAAILSGAFSRNKKIALKDITPLSLDVHYRADNITESLFCLNPTIPKMVYRRKEIKFAKHSSFLFEVFEKENSKPNIVSSTLISWHTKCRGAHNIVVCFNIDANGIYDVSLDLRTSLNEQQFTTKKLYTRLSEEDITRMIKEAESCTAQDEERKRLLQAKSALESDAYIILEQLGDAGNINNDEEEKIREATVKMLESMELITDLSQISVFQEKLSKLQKRME